LRLAAGDCCDLLSSATNSSSWLDRFAPPPVLLALVRLVVPPVHRWRAASHDFSSAYPRELVQRARKSIGMAQQGARIPAARISPSLDSGKGHESAGKGDSLNIKEIERLPSQPLIS